MLPKANNYYSTLLGTILTIFSLVSIYTLIIPVISVIPGALIEWISRLFITNTPYSNVGILTICILSLLLVSTIALFMIRIYRNKKNNKGTSITSILNVLLIEYFIIHALGFYLYWGLVLDFRSDGQLIFAAVDSFKYSSFGFIPLGILIDIVKNK